VEFLSEDGECKEAFLKLGDGTVPGRRRAVLVATGEEREGEAGRGSDVAETGSFLADPDPALRRVGGVDALARELRAARVAPDSTYLFADTPPDSPWLRVYPVLAILPYRPRALARALAAEPPREIVVKQRGLGIPEAAVRRGLPYAEDGPVRVVVLFPRGRRCMACLCGPALPR
jgi:hypothetical protein